MNFGRSVIVELGIPGGEARRFSQLRISGRVEKSPKAGPNSATIEIYNPAPDSIATAQDPRAIVRVLAGYDVPRLLFVGSVSKYGATLARAGADNILSLEALDGGRKYQEAHINETFAASSTLEQILGVLASKLDVQLGAITGIAGQQFPRGVTLAGPVRDVLDDLAASLGTQWSIQDGALQILTDNEDNGESVVVVSSRAGNLIGTPKRSKNGVEVVALLDGRLRPGRRFVVESAEFNGTFRAHEVNHVFDSGWDSSFYTTVVAREVKT